MDPEERLELIAMLAEDRGWDAILAIGKFVLDNVYPAAVFDGSSGDSGPEFIVALRNALERIERETKCR